MQRILRFTACLLLFMMLVYPMTLQLLYPKAILFGFLVVIVLGGLLWGWARLHRSVALWALLLAAISLVFVFEGLFAVHRGAVKALQVYVIWPIAYTILIAGATKLKILIGLQRTLVFSTLFIGMQGLLYFFSQFNIPGVSLFAEHLTFEWDEQAIGFHDEYTGLQFPGLNSLPFLVPYTLATLATGKNHLSKSLAWRTLAWMALFASLAIVLISGRRALLLVCATAPVMTLVFFAFLPSALKTASCKSLGRMVLVSAVAVMALLVAVNSVYEITPGGMLGWFLQGFDFGSTSVDDSATVRREQFHALLRGWFDSPLMGAGHGASAYGSIRSQTMPWSYELQYLALLFQTGLAGLLAYSLGIAWIYWNAIRILREGTLLGLGILPLMVGMSSLLVANATNPYLTRFDGLWAIFLPLVWINFWLLDRKQVSHDKLVPAPTR